MKTICIYHSRDLDGWMSAAIVLRHHVLMAKNQLFLHPEKEDVWFWAGAMSPFEVTFLGWDYGNEIPNLSDYDAVIMCDISFPKEEMLAINKRIGEKFIWIDHHQRTIDEVNDYIIKNGVPMEGSVTVPGELKAACELTWDYFFPGSKIPEVVRLLGRYDCFGHKGTDEEDKVLKFQYGARSIISNYEESYDALRVNMGEGGLINRKVEPISNAGDSIYDYLCTEAKQTYKKAFPIALDEGFTSRSFACVNQERFNPVNFNIDYHDHGYDGFACFWLNNGKWSFSLYNDNGEVDCSAIAKSFGGGGHKGAAGFVVDDLSKVFNP